MRTSKLQHTCSLHGHSRWNVSALLSHKLYNLKFHHFKRLTVAWRCATGDHCYRLEDSTRRRSAPTALAKDKYRAGPTLRLSIVPLDCSYMRFMVHLHSASLELRYLWTLTSSSSRLESTSCILDSPMAHQAAFVSPRRLVLICFIQQA